MKNFILLLLCILGFTSYAQLSQNEYAKLFQTNSAKQYENYLKVYRENHPNGKLLKEQKYVPTEQTNYNTESKSDVNWSYYAKRSNSTPLTEQEYYELFETKDFALYKSYLKNFTPTQQAGHNNLPTRSSYTSQAYNPSANKGNVDWSYYANRSNNIPLTEQEYYELFETKDYSHYKSYLEGYKQYPPAQQSGYSTPTNQNPNAYSGSTNTSGYTYGQTNPNVRYQSGYYRSDGTYVDGHYKTQNNNTNHDNFSTQGNVNPYTGKAGTRAPDYSPAAQNYGRGHTIYTGPRGGQYYINSNGNKTYVPKR